MTNLELPGNPQDGSSLLIELIDLLIESKPPCVIPPTESRSPLVRFWRGGVASPAASCIPWDWSVAEKSLNGFPKVF